MISVDIFSNNGGFIQSQFVSRVPVAGDYLEVQGGFYEVWRVFVTNEDRARVQLSTRLSLSGSQAQMFYY